MRAQGGESSREVKEELNRLRMERIQAMDKLECAISFCTFPFPSFSSSRQPPPPPPLSNTLPTALPPREERSRSMSLQERCREREEDFARSVL